MRYTIICITVFFTLTGNIYCHNDKYSTVTPIVDYTISYSWDILSGDWINPKKNVYVYNDLGQLKETISLDYSTLDSLAKTIYHYNDNGKLVEYLFQEYSASTWINVRKYIILPDEDGRTQTQIVIDWKDGELVYNRKQDYFYNEFSKVSYIIYSAWGGTDWYEIATENYYYNEDGEFVRTESIGINGTVINRVFYETNDYNKRTKMVVQTWAADDWVNVYQVMYGYDPCGNTSFKLRQVFSNGTWVNQSLTEFFWKFALTGDKKTRYPVCRNGQTIMVPAAALNKYLAMGTCPGPCLSDDFDAMTKPETGIGTEVLPFVVYPIPASGSITIKMNDAESSITRVDLTDMFGNILRVMNLGGVNEANVERGNLINGSYLLRIYAPNLYSVKVIFN